MTTIRIVGVHGVGNDRPALHHVQARNQITAAWRRAIGKGPLAGNAERLDLTVAYYAHALRRPGAQGMPADLDRLDVEATTMVHEWLDSLNLPPHIRQGHVTYPLRQALAWIAERDGCSPRLLEWFVSTFFSEVARYLRPGPNPARDNARATVLEAIAMCKPQVVIAHSLGTVVTYEALWQKPSTDLDLLVTLGSPLAMPHVVLPRLEPRNYAKPPGVKRWINIADTGDLIAIPVRGVSTHFTDVDLDTHATIHAFDFHLVANYLAVPELAAALHAHLA